MQEGVLLLQLLSSPPRRAYCLQMTALAGVYNLRFARFSTNMTIVYYMYIYYMLHVVNNVVYTVSVMAWSDISFQSDLYLALA